MNPTKSQDVKNSSGSEAPRRARRKNKTPAKKRPKRSGAILIIPAQNEEKSISLVIRKVPKRLFKKIIVVDNASTDQTASRAREAGAVVVREIRPGYGAACLRGIRHAEKYKPQELAFMDADGSDRPADLAKILEPVASGHKDMVIGSRVGRGTLVHQRAGTKIACWLIEWLFGFRFTDLGPMRAISSACLKSLQMDDMDFGWTAQMQARAARRGLRILEVRVKYGPRLAGRSKVSGSLRGSLGAAVKIPWVILREAFIKK